MQYLPIGPTIVFVDYNTIETDHQRYLWDYRAVERLKELNVRARVFSVLSNPHPIPHTLVRSQEYFFPSPH